MTHIVEPSGLRWQWEVNDQGDPIAIVSRGGVRTVIGSGSVPGLSVGGNAADASANSMAIQTALSAGGQVQITVPNIYQITDTLQMPNDTALYLGAGVTLKAFAANNRKMITNSNTRAVYDGAAVTLIGFQVLYADTATTAGAGTLTYTSVGTTLTWTAPGDTAGTPVNINTPGFYRIASGTAGKAIYVLSPSGDRPAGNASMSVYVSTIKGASICTGVLSSNVLTVTETAHGRLVGDIVEVYYPAGPAVTVGEVASVTSADVYTVAWTRADFASAAIAVHGTRNQGIYGPGTIDQQRSTQTNGNTLERFPVVFRNASKVRLDGYSLINAQGHGNAMRQTTDVIATNLRGSNVQNLLQFEGYLNRAEISNLQSASVELHDDLLAFTNTALTAGSYNYIGTATISNMTNIDVSGIQSEGGHNAAVKWTGFTGSKLDGVNIRGITGSGTNPAIYITDDTASLTGGTTGKVCVTGVNWTVTGANSLGEVLNYDQSGGADSLEFRDVKWNGTGGLGFRLNASSGTITNLAINASTQFGTQPNNSFVSPSQAITKLSLNDCILSLGASAKVVTVNNANCNISTLQINGGYWTGNAAANGVYHSTGTVTNCSFNNLYASTITEIYRTVAGASNTPRIHVNGVVSAGTGNGINCATSAVINVGSWYAFSIGNNLIQDSGGTITLNAGGTLDYTGFGSVFLGSGAARNVNGMVFKQSPAFSATPTFRLSNGNIITPGVMTANITAITLQDIPPAGQVGSFVFTQDGTGGRTLAGAFPATVKFPTAAYTDTGNTANKKTTLNWVSDGTNLIVQGTNAWN